MFGIMFQIICFSVWKNIIVCLVYVCFIFKELTSTVQFNVFYLRRENVVYVLSHQVGPMTFNIFTKMSLSSIVWKLKIDKRSFLNSNTPLNNTLTKLLFFISQFSTFREYLIGMLKQQFSITLFYSQIFIKNLNNITKPPLKHWKLLFTHPTCQKHRQ